MNYYIIGYKNKPIGESGESCKSEYDFKDACDICGTGAKLIKDLRVKGFSKINKDFFETLDGDFIISKRIYEIIKQDQLRFILKPVVDYKNNKLDFYHLNPSNVLPKFENKSTGYIIENQCEKCNRNGFFNDFVIGDLGNGIETIVHPLYLVYKENDLKAINNDLILKTWECVGLSNKETYGKYVVRYARPWIIINQVLKDIFEKLKIEGVNYEQIKLE